MVRGLGSAPRGRCTVWRCTACGPGGGLEQVRAHVRGLAAPGGRLAAEEGLAAEPEVQGQPAHPREVQLGEEAGEHGRLACAAHAVRTESAVHRGKAQHGVGSDRLCVWPWWLAEVFEIGGQREQRGPGGGADRACAARRVQGAQHRQAGESGHCTTRAIEGHVHAVAGRGEAAAARRAVTRRAVHVSELEHRREVGRRCAHGCTSRGGTRAAANQMHANNPHRVCGRAPSDGSKRSAPVAVPST